MAGLRGFNYSTIFQNGGGRYVGFLKLQSCNCGTHHKCRIASSCQISWQLVKPLSRYLDFRFFKMVAATILDTQNFKFLTVGTVKREELHQRAKFRQNRLNRDRCMAIFQDGGRRHLGFLKFYNLTIRTAKKDELRQYAKFCRNRPNHGGDMSVFDFSKWRPLPSWIFEISNF